MFPYYLELGALGLARSKLVTVLIVMLIGVGVAGSVTTFAMLRAVSADLLPKRSRVLFVAQIDNRGPAGRATDDNDLDPELTLGDAVSRFRNYLKAYADDQRANGRFQWPTTVELHDLQGWLTHMRVVPPETRISFIVSLGLLSVSAVNAAGLLLARFMRSSTEIGIRRALGASRGAIYQQYLTEAGMIGVTGGVVGGILTLLGVNGLGFVFDPKLARIVHVDIVTLLSAILLAVAVTLVAALYPVWRLSRVDPAWQLKIG